MNNLQTNSQTLRVADPAIRELSTAQRKDWIERIFNRLSGIYGSEFTYKWADVDSDALKAEWADALGGFHAEDIASALQACRAQPKAPNLPEFATLCRQNMSTRTTVKLPPLTPAERVAAAKIAQKVAQSLGAKDEKPKDFKRWAYRLMEREAKGESLPHVSKMGWREALGYPLDTEAKTAMGAAA